MRVGLAGPSRNSIPDGLLIIASLLLCLLAPFSQAEETVERYQPRQIELVDSDEVDQVDPRSGNLIIRHRDLFLPGNGGLDIEVWRNYDMASASSGLRATHNHSYRWTALGPGWTLGAAPRIFYNNYYWPSYNGYDYGNANYDTNAFDDMCLYPSVASTGHSERLPRLQLPNGEQQEIYVTGNEGYTKSGWKVTCLSNVITATSPAGVKYDFGTFSERRIGKYLNYKSQPVFGFRRYDHPTQTYFVAKSATDVWGNKLEYTYQQFGTPITPWPITGRTYSVNYAYRVLVTETAEKNETPSLQLAAIVSSDGRRVDFTYDAGSGRLQSMRDNTGRTWSYEYLTPDTNNSRTLSKATLPTGQFWAYGYEPGAFSDVSGSGESAKIPSIRARKLIRLTTLNKGSVSYDYEEYLFSDRIYLSSGSYRSEIQGERVNKRTLSTGETWLYSYTRGGAGEYDTTLVNGPDGTTTYKFMGPRYVMRYRNLSDGPGSAGYQDNAWQVGQLMAKTDPSGTTETYVWKPRVLTDRQFILKETGYIWDEKVWAPVLEKRTVVRDGATYSTTYADFDAYGNPGKKTESGPNGGNRTTNYTYFNDPNKWILGLVKDEVFAGGSLYRSYDANGKLLTATKDGVTSGFTYDAQGNLASLTTPRGQVYSYSDYKRGIAQVESQPEGITINRVVDNAGNITAETNGDGHTTTYTYDGLNRLTSEAKPRGNKLTITYAPNSKLVTRGNLIEKTEYDPFGKISSVTLGGIVTRFKYDVFGRKTFESHPGETIGTSYQYDALGRLVRIVNGDGTYQTHRYGSGTHAITDERGHTTTYTYKAYGDPDEQFLMGISAPVSVSSASIALTRNARDLVTSVTQGSLPRTYTRTYGYNDNYYLTSITNPETGVTKYGRDAEGNMTTRQVGESGVTTYAYDGQNRLSSVVYPGTTNGITYSYNKTGKLVSAKRYNGDRDFSYDANNNITSETLSGRGQQFKVEYTYDGNDKLASITYPYSGRLVSYTNDVFGRPIKIPGYINSVTYWPSGLIKQINYANGTVSNYSKNTRLWPSEFKTRKAGLSNYYLNTAYRYDGIGNLTSLQDSVDSTLNRTLGYDPVNRLVTANGFWGNGAITYDEVGNLTSQVLGNTSLNYRYDSSNRLESVSGLRAATYAYDAYGNVSASANSTYVYDGVPNLRCIDCNNSLTKTEYDYDALNHRFFVKQKGVPSYEIYDPSGKLLSELTIGQPNKLTEYIYLGGKRIAQRVSP